MDSLCRATMYAALLLAVLATISAAPQFQDGGGSFNRFPPPRGSSQSGPPVYYDDEEEDSSEDELSFFQRLVRPWRWLDPVYDFFSSGNEDEEEIYDEGNFPGRFPGQQVARLDQRPPFRTAPGQAQRYVARPPPPSQPLQTARSDSAVYQPAQLAAEAMHAEPADSAGSQA